MLFKAPGPGHCEGALASHASAGSVRLSKPPAFGPTRRRDFASVRSVCTGQDMDHETSDTDARDTALAAIERLLKAAREFHGARSIRDAIDADLDQISKSLGLDEQLAATRIAEVVRGVGIVDAVMNEADAFVADLPERDLFVLKRRTLSPDPPTLEALGRELGVTRERARQLQVRATAKLDERLRPKLEPIANLIRSRLGPVVSQHAIQEKIETHFSDLGRPGTSLLRQWMMLNLGYSTVDGTGMDRRALEVVDHLKSEAWRMADEVGLVEEGWLKQALPGHDWSEHWDELVARAGIHRMFGCLALRDTVRAKIKSALLSIGRPATRSEIAELVGANPKKLGAQLSGTPGVVRAGKTRWAIRDWIEDVYEGIPAEIIQRIQEDGGATATERLVEELPRLFEVSEASVRAHISTPQFSVRDGFVSLADPSTIQYRDLEDVIDGRDGDGVPYWSFVAQDKFLRGYSLLRFPPELARQLGCGPNQKVSVPLAAPTDCGPLSVIWRTSSVNGASLGFLAEPLKSLRVVEGDRVRLALVGGGAAALSVIRSRDEEEKSPKSADGILRRMKKRRRVL